MPVNTDSATGNASSTWARVKENILLFVFAVSMTVRLGETLAAHLFSGCLCEPVLVVVADFVKQFTKPRRYHYTAVHREHCNLDK
jgi:hypothetical protein